jgi:hypothetical protein
MMVLPFLLAVPTSSVEIEFGNQENSTNLVNVNSTRGNGNTNKMQRQTWVPTTELQVLWLEMILKVPLCPLITYYLIICQK